MSSKYINIYTKKYLTSGFFCVIIRQNQKGDKNGKKRLEIISKARKK